MCSLRHIVLLLASQNEIDALEEVGVHEGGVCCEEVYEGLGGELWGEDLELLEAVQEHVGGLEDQPGGDVELWGLNLLHQHSDQSLPIRIFGEVAHKPPIHLNLLSIPLKHHLQIPLTQPIHHLQPFIPFPGVEYLQHFKSLS